ncbi:TetR/AcrR family transcriptional regulator [Nocardioides marmoriginsengisoli]|nr:TetR/AcrR family transcriptional regulator [Nocardioides marmoriginsengisoli]
MKTSRSYRQTARAEASEQTRRRIIEAAFALQAERLSAEISLDDVAERAGVSVQTVLRRFGSKAALIEESIRWINAEIAEERRAPAGDVPAAIHALLDHYEKRGDFALLMLAQENAYDHVRQLSDAGKGTHRTWVAEVFGPYLPHGAGRRDELLDLLVVATDVYTWKLLRRDRGLTRKETENRITTLVTALLPQLTTEATTGKESS